MSCTPHKTFETQDIYEVKHVRVREKSDTATLN